MLGQRLAFGMLIEPPPSASMLTPRQKMTVVNLLSGVAVLGIVVSFIIGSHGDEYYLAVEIDLVSFGCFVALRLFFRERMKEWSEAAKS